MAENSLEELIKLSAAALYHPGLVSLARENSPSRTYDLSKRLFNHRKAKSARYLAILRRDHGSEAFEAVVSQ
ncbi:MAG: hypothetical protein KDD69_14170, partial [Bdellovibrionales bacterium]|nr:hypothetical protein [Bdellovibrionales bacterium]